MRWRADGAPPPLIATLEQAGFQAHLFDFEPDSKDGARSELVRALAVAGFAASNIMLLSVSVWGGRRSRDPQPVSLALGNYRAAGAGIFRVGILPVGLAGREARTPKYGCADLAWRAAGLRD